MLPLATAQACAMPEAYLAAIMAFPGQCPESLGQASRPAWSSTRHRTHPATVPRAAHAQTPNDSAVLWLLATKETTTHPSQRPTPLQPALAARQQAWMITQFSQLCALFCRESGHSQVTPPRSPKPQSTTALRPPTGGPRHECTPAHLRRIMTPPPTTQHQQKYYRASRLECH